jgi:hypothetical protein
MVLSSLGRLIAGAVAFLLVAGGPAIAEKRYALVIGNNAYANISSLQKAVNDAQAVGEVLGEIGFAVTRLENATKAEMSRAIGSLEQAIAPGDTVFFFFAGHGIDISGTNFLLPSDVPAPVDASGRRQPTRTIRDASFNASEVLASLKERGAGVVIAVFDACRESFNEEGYRSLGSPTRGLARMDPARGMFIMFSAGAKQLALDRLRNDNHPNSVFTRTLVPLLKEPGLSLVEVAKQLQPRVEALAAQVDHVQTPAYYDEIRGHFYLVKGGRTDQPIRPVAIAPPPAALSVPDPCAGAHEHWKSAEAMGSKSAVQDHLARFPNCSFAGLARMKLAALDQPPPPPDPCAGASDHWRSAEIMGSRSALQDHLTRFSGCNFAGLARAKLAALDQAPPPPPPPVTTGSLPSLPAPDSSVCRGAGSLWDFSGTTVYLQGTGDSPARRFYLCQGARAGSLLFSGRRSGDRYTGTAYVQNRCGSFPYDVAGSVSNGHRTVVISGRRPVVDESTCKVSGHNEARLEFHYRSRN